MVLYLVVRIVRVKDGRNHPPPQKVVIPCYPKSVTKVCILSTFLSKISLNKMFAEKRMGQSIQKISHMGSKSIEENDQNIHETQ